MRFSKYIAYIMILVLAVPLNSLYASAKGKVSTVIVPVRDGVADGETQDAASLLNNSLRQAPDFYVVEQAKVESVLQYYNKEADNPIIKKVDELLIKAKESYYQLNYQEAKSLARKAISDLTSNPHLIYDHGKTLLDAHLTLGIVAKSMGDAGEARQAFREALRLDPGYKLDSRAFPPSLINLFESVRSSLDMVPRGSVKVVSDPKVVEVYLDGIMKGVTPLTIENVTEGEHYLKLGANKYKAINKKINVESGKAVKVREKLQWTVGKAEKLSGKTYVGAVDEVSQVEEGLRIADLLRVDKVVLVDADGGSLMARMVDSKVRTGHKPLVVPYKNGKGSEAAVANLAKEITSLARVNIASNPGKYAEPVGAGDPNMMGSKNRSKISKPVLFGILGGVLAIGLGAGLAAAFAGGGGGNTPQAQTGSVNLTFK